jgi:hypothetical protein
MIDDSGRRRMWQIFPAIYSDRAISDPPRSHRAHGVAMHAA